MPAPRNLETARRVEAAVRAGGAVPATIAVLDGRIRVGLTADDLERLAGEKEVAKASRADLPAVLASGGAGSTTRSEEHTSELQSLMRISYAVFCLKKKHKRYKHQT